MNSTYLGETPVDLFTDPEFKNYGPKEWAMHFITTCGQIEGDHHSKWVLDQVARVLHGGVPKVTLARWSDGNEEHRVHGVPATEEYLKWVKEMKGNITVDDEGVEEPEYTYDEGIAP